MKMVKVLLIEDSADKQELISSEVRSFFGDGLRKLDICETFSSASRAIISTKYDLIITDLLLPRRANDEPVDFSEDLLEYLTDSINNKNTITVAISRFGNVVEEKRDIFLRHGIFLLPFGRDDAWRQCLNICMQRVEQTLSCDFLILCGLNSERGAFRDVPELQFGKFIKIGSLDCCEASIGESKGYIVVQPRMGLVDAAITSSIALETFKPKFSAMAGICAGFESQVKLGTLVVTDICWDHQSGKWKGEEFQERPYQEPIHPDVRVIANQIIESDPDLVSFRQNFRELARAHDDCAVIAPTVSGSFVLAAEQFGGEIQEQHGKLAALDMEIFGFHRAAALYGAGLQYFAAKTVVDYADEHKGNDFQRDGAVLSARFVTRVLAELIARQKLP